MIHVYAGTRPEIIKLAPVIWGLRRQGVEHKLIFTGQHWGEMVTPFIEQLDVAPDLCLNACDYPNFDGYSLNSIVGHLMSGVVTSQPDVIVVQGDTASAFGVALAAFHQHIPVAHVEAGLRTGDVNQPWPEEFYRTAITRMASYHYCPTLAAQSNVRSEVGMGTPALVTGNTIIDVVTWMLRNKKIPRVSSSKPFLLVTVHRRENIQRMYGACKAVDYIANQLGIDVIWPLHPNPDVREVVEGYDFKGNVNLVDPMDYPRFLAHVRDAVAVFSDSGGVAEEVTCFGTPLVIYRDKTERNETCNMGLAILHEDELRSMRFVEDALATRESNRGVLRRLRRLEHHVRVKSLNTPYGDGEAAKHIVNHLRGVV